jgi:hypothetical protein
MHKKRWYVVFGVVAVLLFVGSVLNTSWLTESLLGQFLAEKPGISVKRVHFGQQHFALPGRLELRAVDLALEINGKLLTVQVPDVVITGLQTFGATDRRVLISAQRMTVRYDMGFAKEFKADLTIDRDGVSGPLTAVELDWDKLRAKDA